MDVAARFPLCTVTGQPAKCISPGELFPPALAAGSQTGCRAGEGDGRRRNGQFLPSAVLQDPVTNVTICTLQFSEQGDLKSELCTETPLPGPGQERDLSPPILLPTSGKQGPLDA